VSSGPSSLILGFAARISPALFEPFAASLRETGYEGRFALVIAQYDAADRRRFAELADLVVAVDDAYPAPRIPLPVGALRWMREQRGVRRAYPAAFSLAAAAASERRALDRWRYLEFQLEGLQALRYAHYYDILRRVGPDATEILLTDVRDVLFQADPFAAPVERLEIVLEEPHVAIGSDPFNGSWIRNLYGPAELAALAHHTASCSGTVIGPRREILHYLREMSAAIMTRRRPLGSHDQGVHNHLLRRDRLGDPAIVPNGSGRVLTMGALTDVVRVDDGRVLNADGTVPAVIHQYDRHPRLAAELVARLRHDPAPAGI
jgi:hypothetical protein